MKITIASERDWCPMRIGFVKSPLTYPRDKLLEAYFQSFVDCIFLDHRNRNSRIELCQNMSGELFIVILMSINSINFIFPCRDQSRHWVTCKHNWSQIAMSKLVSAWHWFIHFQTIIWLAMISAFISMCFLKKNSGTAKHCNTPILTFDDCFVPSSKNPAASNNIDVNDVDPAFGARQT